MGKVMSLVTRPMKNYNIESRAHKIISKEKPKPAPRYEASIKEAEELLKGIIITYKNTNKFVLIRSFLTSSRALKGTQYYHSLA